MAVAFALASTACGERADIGPNVVDAGTAKGAREKDAASGSHLHDAGSGPGKGSATPDSGMGTGAKPEMGPGHTADAGAKCPAGSARCGGVCIDVAYDPKNCGGCGAACAIGELCSAGQCATTCLGGSVACGSRCVDPENDPANCGGCGHACDPGSSCSRGTCVLGCSGGTVECDGRCADTQTDPAACGACDHACVTGEYCSAGQCTATCAAPSQICDGECTDTANDRNNCGACGNACAAGQVCSDGACQLECGGGTTKCGDACAATASDPANCGGCGIACATGEYCSNGACARCSDGLAECNGQCVDLKTNVGNCGQCGNACPYVYSGAPSCVAGVCSATCSNGYAACGSPPTSCSTYLSTDSKNCGSCGNACKTNEYCTGGVCTACGPGLSGCSGRCVDLTSDRNNCGQCANYCPYPYNATSTCVASVCSSTCTTGYADCNESSSDGCEVALNTDRNNCGACGKACATNELCSQGVCAACAPGRTMCSNTCVDLGSDANNCGKCGMPCSASTAHATSACKSATCTITCAAGYLDCDGNVLTGCETASDVKNCGACGKACGTGQLCVSGSCAACAPTNLGSAVPVAFTGTMAGRPDSFQTSCGGQNLDDDYFSFTAPSAGMYTIQASGSYSYYSMVVEVRDGGCNGAALGCNLGGPAQLTVALAAKQKVVIVVESYYASQSYTLSVR
ncbi:MAG TPA: MXAN_6577-like cysteine-rich protein [Polyangiaceae bacterium]|nr:MXAN_6577-like cysteine-rich protein [Polyangiaceae bacterium]